jgi:hypothetical protein
MYQPENYGIALFSIIVTAGKRKPGGSWNLARR